MWTVREKLRDGRGGGIDRQKLIKLIVREGK